MTLSFPNFQPDQIAIIPLNSYGIPIVFQCIDDKGNVINLTNVQSIELELKHKTDNSVTKITKLATKSDANNGIAYVVTAPNDIKAIGQYKPSAILYYAESAEFPNGRKIPAFASIPEVIEVVD